jgi:hypothetical protein
VRDYFDAKEHPVVQQNRARRWAEDVARNEAAMKYISGIPRRMAEKKRKVKAEKELQVKLKDEDHKRLGTGLYSEEALHQAREEKENAELEAKECEAEKEKQRRAIQEAVEEEWRLAESVKQRQEEEARKQQELRIERAHLQADINQKKEAEKAQQKEGARLQSKTDKRKEDTRKLALEKARLHAEALEAKRFQTEVEQAKTLRELRDQYAQNEVIYNQLVPAASALRPIVELLLVVPSKKILIGNLRDIWSEHSQFMVQLTPERIPNMDIVSNQIEVLLFAVTVISPALNYMLGLVLHKARGPELLETGWNFEVMAKLSTLFRADPRLSQLQTKVDGICSLLQYAVQASWPSSLPKTTLDEEEEESDEEGEGLGEEEESGKNEDTDNEDESGDNEELLPEQAVDDKPTSDTPPEEIGKEENPFFGYQTEVASGISGFATPQNEFGTEQSSVEKRSTKPYTNLPQRNRRKCLHKQAPGQWKFESESETKFESPPGLSSTASSPHGQKRVCFHKPLFNEQRKYEPAPDQHTPIKASDGRAKKPCNWGSKCTKYPDCPYKHKESLSRVEIEDSEVESGKNTVVIQPKAAGLHLALRIKRPDKQTTIEDEDDEMECTDVEESELELGFNKKRVQMQQTSRRNEHRRSNTPRHNVNRGNNNPRRNNNRRTPASRGGRRIGGGRGSPAAQTTQNNGINRRQNLRQVSATHRIIEAGRALAAGAKQQQSRHPLWGPARVYPLTHCQSQDGQPQRLQNRNPLRQVQARRMNASAWGEHPDMDRVLDERVNENHNGVRGGRVNKKGDNRRGVRRGRGGYGRPG